VSNKVRPFVGGGVGASGPVLIMLTVSTASIQDPTAALRSRRYLATMQADHTGWVLSVNAQDGTYGPYKTAEAAYDWYMHNRHNLPPGRVPPRRHTDWPPGSPWDVDE
jgi:hypothetical protein